MFPTRVSFVVLASVLAVAPASASDNSKSNLDKNALLGGGLSASDQTAVNGLNTQLAQSQQTLSQAQAQLAGLQQQLPAAQQALTQAQQVYAASQDQSQTAHQALRQAVGVSQVRAAFDAVDAADGQLADASSALNSASNTYAQITQTILQDTVTIQQMQALIAYIQAQIAAITSGAPPPPPPPGLTADATGSDSGNDATQTTAIASIQGGGQADGGDADGD